MSVCVQCPHCSSLCQVEEQHLASALRCGKCGQTFAVRAGAASPSALGGLKAKLRGMFQSLLPSGSTESPAGPAASEADAEAFLDLDGPALAAQKKTDAWPAASSAPTFRLDIGGATSVGRVRSRNEDSFLVQQLSWSNQDRRHDAALIVVADGMGGYAAGDLASGLLTQAAAAILTPLLLNLLNGQEVAPPARVEAVGEAIRHANRTILQRAQADSACRGMGSTVAVVLVVDGQVTIGHVGDCRVYHQSADRLVQVTKDQTLVARLAEMGQLSEQEAATHPARNEVLQAVGRHPEVEPAGYELALKPGEWLIVACDGLHAHVDRPALERAVWEATSTVALAGRLVELADQGGGSDNCTVVAVRCY